MPNDEDKEDQNAFMRGILSILSNSQPDAGDTRVPRLLRVLLAARPPA